MRMTLMRFALLVLLVAACERRREIKILYGPAEGQLSQGFACVDNSGRQLITRAPVIAPGVRRASVIIDMLQLGSGAPGCRGEALIRACERDGTCTLVPQETRFCHELEIRIANTDEAAAVADIEAQLADRVVTTDAPDRTIIVRAILTAQSCAEVEAGAELALDQLVGCAYSCPFVPDAIEGPVALGLDAFNNTCETLVNICARFPGTP